VADAARNQPRAGGVLLAVAAAVLLMLAVGVLSAGEARAASSGVTVSLTDDTGGQALFPGVRLSPGVRRATCLSIDAAGAAAGDQVVMAAQSVTGGLAPWIQVDVEIGTGGGHGSCAGFNGSPIFSGTLTDLGNPVGDGYPTGWDPATVTTRTFRITVEVANTRAAIGQTAAAAFSWRLVQVATPTPSRSTSGPTSPAAPSGSPSTSPTQTPGLGTATPSPTLSPGSTATPTVAPSSDTTEVPHGQGGGPGGPGSRSGTADHVDLYLGQDLSDGIGRLQRAAEPLARTVVAVVKHPQPVLWSALAAVLFLLVQHRIDMSDPKLLGASRTQREQMLVFPLDYRPWEDL